LLSLTFLSFPARLFVLRKGFNAWFKACFSLFRQLNKTLGLAEFYAMLFKGLKTGALGATETITHEKSKDAFIFFKFLFPKDIAVLILITGGVTADLIFKENRRLLCGQPCWIFLHFKSVLSYLGFFNSEPSNF
jgi:hypothetical protein